MTETQDSFFVSDSLKDILSQDDALEQAFDIKAKKDSDVKLIGKVVMLDLDAMKAEVDTTQKAVQSMLENPNTLFYAEFLGETLVLDASRMKVKLEDSGRAKALLPVTERK